MQAYVLFSCPVVSDSLTQWAAARQASLSFTISQSLLRLMSAESVMPSNCLKALKLNNKNNINPRNNTANS